MLGSASGWLWSIQGLKGIPFTSEGYCVSSNSLGPNFCWTLVLNERHYRLALVLNCHEKNDENSRSWICPSSTAQNQYPSYPSWRVIGGSRIWWISRGRSDRGTGRMHTCFHWVLLLVILERFLKLTSLAHFPDTFSEYPSYPSFEG